MIRAVRPIARVLLLKRAKAYPAGIDTKSVNAVAHVAIIIELVRDSKSAEVSNFLYVERVGEKKRLDCVENTSASCLKEVRTIQMIGMP